MGTAFNGCYCWRPFTNMAAKFNAYNCGDKRGWHLEYLYIK